MRVARLAWIGIAIISLSLWLAGCSSVKYDISGKWVASVQYVESEGEKEIELDLEQSGTRVTGVVNGVVSDLSAQKMWFVTGTVRKDNVVLEAEEERVTVTQQGQQSLQRVLFRFEGTFSDNGTERRLKGDGILQVCQEVCQVDNFSWLVVPYDKPQSNSINGF